ncbi:hypothetical protein [Sphingobacterium faecium]|uniref:hypothetical protein n=1 Tax=Sphingobacterium faecium TaxID=34087 RepID=UPI0024695199|nr:hypothetical protein [Sphingobacterium faecium]MDH5826267.1 hypothetical protein [Sphingobacterium faecium]
MKNQARRDKLTHSKANGKQFKYSQNFIGRQYKNKGLLSDVIVQTIEKNTGTSLLQLKDELSEVDLFTLGLKYVTTTKKAYCTALGIALEAGCRYKRYLEKSGILVQSINKVVCPYTNHYAYALSTNPNEFKRLRTSNNRQLDLFQMVYYDKD